MDKQEALREISQKIAAAGALIQECETIAKEANVSFYWDGGTSGLGQFNGEQYRESAEDEGDGSGEYTWSTSSIGC